MIVKGHKIGPRADLRGVDLSGENLTGANLSGTNLRGANLYGANLSDANLSDVNLIGANLSYANLRGANLVRAYLSWANLCGTNLSDANLKWADLPPPTTVLMAEWGKLSDSLTADLMAYDAACHPDPSAFDKWAKITDGPCPYDCIKVQRAAQFKQSRRLWDPARPLRRPYDLMADVIREKCSFSDFH